MVVATDLGEGVRCGAAVCWGSALGWLGRWWWAVHCLLVGRCAYPRLGLLAWAVHPIRRRCTRSDRVQRPARGVMPSVGVAVRTVVELVTPKRWPFRGALH